MNRLIIAFFLSAFLALLLTPLVKKLAIRFGCFDTPSTRKIHLTPTPYLGGIALYLAVGIPLFFVLEPSPSLIGIVLGASFITLIGVIDDLFHISAFYKLILQVLSAMIAIEFGNIIPFISHPFGGLIILGSLSVPVTILWTIGITNTLNLVDGSDGLAAGISGITSAVLAIVAFQTGQMEAAIVSMLILGACIGFLPYNFSPAQIFMGDSGSMFLGFMLAMVSISGVLKSTISLALLIPILVLGIPIFDVFFSIIRRIRRGQWVFEADTDHFHHQLLRQGMSPKTVALWMYVISILLGCLAIFISF